MDSSAEGPLKLVQRPHLKPTRPPFRRAKIVSVIGTATIIAFHSVPHLFPQMNKTTFGMKTQPEMPEAFSEIYQETCEKMGIKNPEDGEVFFNAGFTTVSAGSFDLPNKAVIGLPRSFLIDSAEKLRDTKIRFDDNLVDWNSKAGKALEKALIVKNDYVAFAMAHELAHIKSYDFVYRCLFPAAWFYGTCRGIMWLIPRAKNAPTKAFKALLAILLAGCSAFLYSETSRVVKKRIELQADETAAKCGLRYCNGGISYLKSKMRMNRVIRHMTGVSGVQRYTAEGDDLDNETHPRLTDRIKLIERIKENCFADGDKTE